MTEVTPAGKTVLRCAVSRRCCRRGMHCSAMVRAEGWQRRRVGLSMPFSARLSSLNPAHEAAVPSQSIPH